MAEAVNSAETDLSQSDNPSSSTQPNASAGSSDQKTVVKKPGLVYLSSVPDSMQVAMVKDIFSRFGRITRIFLKPIIPSAENHWQHKRVRHYEEGWVEFEDGRKAKKAAKAMNCSAVEGRRKRWSGQLWCCKFQDRSWDEVTCEYREAKAMALGNKKKALLAAKRAKKFFRLSRTSEEMLRLVEMKNKDSEDARERLKRNAHLQGASIEKDSVCRSLF